MMKGKEDEDSKDGVWLQAQIDLLSSTRLYAGEALNWQAYLDNC